MTLSAALLLALGLATSSADTAKPAPAPPPTTIPELKARIEDVLQKNKMPGLSITLVTRDSVLWADGLGLADVAAGRKATAQTLFRIGSTSKAFTAFTVVMLQAEGKLSLQDPISKYAPEIVFSNKWEATDPVRIVNTLEHSTGFDDWSLKNLSNSDPRQISLKEGLDYDPTSRVSRWRPGTRQSYSNSGPSIAAYIVQKVEGKPFEQIVQERLFDPIGMKTATYMFPDTTKVERTQLYQADGKTPYPYWYVLQRPAGSINASANDMAQYVRFLLNRGAVDGKQLIPAAVLDSMEHPRASTMATIGLPNGYGLHLGTYVDSGFVWRGHDGGVPGGITNMAYIPELGVGYAFMTNGGGGAGFHQIAMLVQNYLTRNFPKPTLPPRAPLDPSIRAEYSGWYIPDNPRNQHLYFLERATGLFRVSTNDTAVVFKPFLGKAETFLPVSATMFRGPAEPVATVAMYRDPENGRDHAIEQMGYLLPNSFSRIHTASAWLQIVVMVGWVAALIGTALVAVYRLIRFFVRRARHQPGPTSTSLFWWPLVIAVIVATLVLVTGSSEAVFRLTSRNATSVSIFLLGLAFAIAAALGFISALRGPSRVTTPTARWTGRIVATLHLIVAVYLVVMGFVGWRPWA